MPESDPQYRLSEAIGFGWRRFQSVCLDVTTPNGRRALWWVISAYALAPLVRLVLDTTWPTVFDAPTFPRVCSTYTDLLCMAFVFSCFAMYFIAGEAVLAYRSNAVARGNTSEAMWLAAEAGSLAARFAANLKNPSTATLDGVDERRSRYYKRRVALLEKPNFKPDFDTACEQVMAGIAHLPPPITADGVNIARDITFLQNDQIMLPQAAAIHMRRLMRRDQQDA